VSLPHGCERRRWRQHHPAGSRGLLSVLVPDWCLQVEYCKYRLLALFESRIDANSDLQLLGTLEKESQNQDNCKKLDPLLGLIVLQPCVYDF
jgi:hypothetical protein